MDRLCIYSRQCGRVSPARALGVRACRWSVPRVAWTVGGVRGRSTSVEECVYYTATSGRDALLRLGNGARGGEEPGRRW